ncbi:RNA polymerase sigma factor [Pseudobacter ginsenosidimutans]|uniref:RNA polymerase sigma factor n=1 Tax=Pseudobacter ginsenosidimutans TaxID=661488 RepID=A0A4Q7N2G4_9BACT|nr:sigma-70 family RNA polymerase sigma factor [Pseudobacter ginsenosidimutans]RZS75019.1 RNA polymerase ECF family sigma subunit [Pseudobacter ginsenosidimutans]
MSIYQSYAEQQLLLQISRRDELAFAELVKRYRENIYTTALRLVHRRVLAEEVLQDVFLKVWLNAAGLPELDNFPAWLNRVARNTIYTAFRQSLKENVVELNEEVEEAAHFLEEDRILDKEYSALLHEAVNSLPPRQQQTWRLIREEGKKRAEVAAELNISPETVKFHLEAAVKNVRAYCLSRLPAAIAMLLIGIK